VIRYILKIISGILIVGACFANSAQTGISIALGSGTKRIQAYRLNLQRSWAHSCKTHNCRVVDGYWELAFMQMRGTKNFDYYTNKNMQATSASAVVRIKDILKLPLFVDLGLGLAYMSRQEISTRNLGSNLVFEERIGLGLLLGSKKQIECSYRLVHYSNGYLAQYNNGLNLQLFILGYWFN